MEEPECSQCKCLPISAGVVVVTQCRVHCTPFDTKTKLFWQNDEIILFRSYYAKKLTIIIKLPKEEFEVQEGTRMIDY